VLISCAGLEASGNGALKRLPTLQVTPIGSPVSPAAVILVPEDAAYQRIGEKLSDDVFRKTGVRLSVEKASGYVSGSPRSVQGDKTRRHFILLGQFWNNAVFERLYANYYDPVDSFFPGPGGYELRTVCSPFRAGHNCVVATGSDATGCEKAARVLVGKISDRGVPFLLESRMTGEALGVERKLRARVSKLLPELDRYIVYGHPQAKTFNGFRDPDNLPYFHDYNLGTAASFGVHYWVTGNKEDGDIYRRIMKSTMALWPRLKELYKQHGYLGIIDYAGPQSALVWNLIGDSEIFTDEERQQFTDYVYDITYAHRNSFFAYKCKDIPLEDVQFFARHQHAGMFWLWAEARYVLEKCDPDPEQRAFAEEYIAHGAHYLKRLMMSPMYLDSTYLLQDQSGVVMIWMKMMGATDFIDNGSLRWLADYWAANNGNTGETSVSGWSRPPGEWSAQGASALSTAASVYPEADYGWFVERVLRGVRWSYANFIFSQEFQLYRGTKIWSLPYFNWEHRTTSPAKPGAAPSRMLGVTFTLLPAELDRFQRHKAYRSDSPMAGLFVDTDAPLSRTPYRIAFREGFGANDQFMAVQCVQDMLAYYNEFGSVLKFDDQGRGSDQRPAKQLLQLQLL